MRVLILSCNTGGGHNSCAYALADMFKEQGEQCEVKDALSFVSDNFSEFMEKGHIAMYRYFPWFFRWGYGICERYPVLFENKGGIYRLLKLGTKRLYKYIQAEKYDVIICVHIFSALMMSSVIRRYQIEARTCFVATDYTCSPGVRETCMDDYFIPHETLMEEFLENHISREKVVVSGIPVNQQFYERELKKNAKQQLGIPESVNHMVIMCGSMGCGPLLPLIEELVEKVDHSHHITVVCGSNEKLKKQLKIITEKNKQFQIMGYVEDMSSLLDSADVYMTKPGGLSTTEAANKSIPMIFINAVAGCEVFNREFFVRHGCGLSADSVDILVQLCLELINDEKRRMEMGLQAEKIFNRNSAKVIVEHIRRVTDED